MTAVVEAAHDRVERCKTAVNAALIKADTKAIALTAASGTMLAIAAQALAGTGAVGPARAGLTVAAGMWAAAMLAALAALFPHLGGDHGFVRWARMTPAECAAEVEEPGQDDGPRAVVSLSRLGMVKYRLIQAAIGLLIVSLVPLAAGWLV